MILSLNYVVSEQLENQTKIEVEQALLSEWDVDICGTINSIVKRIPKFVPHSNDQGTNEVNLHL
jgi:hypothetical protein